LCAKSHMLSASRQQPHLLHVNTVDRRQTWYILTVTDILLLN